VTKIAIEVPVSEIARAAEQLGLVRAIAVPSEALEPSFYRRAEGVNAAITHVVRATERFERDQYTQAEHHAATALFEAAKRLRKAVHEEHKSKQHKGNFRV
jgi:hypothetical protein